MTADEAKEQVSALAAPEDGSYWKLNDGMSRINDPTYARVDWVTRGIVAVMPLRGAGVGGGRMGYTVADFFEVFHDS